MRILAGLLIFLATFGSTASAEPKSYKLDPSHTIVAFFVDHIGYSRMLGRFTDVAGTFVYDTETQELSDLRVVVKTASVASDHKRRDDHVRGADFLDVKKFPEMIFTAASGTPDSANHGTVAGELTLLGQTKPLVLDVTLNKFAKYPFGHKKPTLGISARSAVMRSEYGMSYGVAGGLVGDRVDIIIEIEAIQVD